MIHPVKLPPTREEFGRRLRALRIPRGYRTARSFALALGIDENRYTRYERGEVEPDLSLLQRICHLLAITPNQLLGHDDSGSMGSSFAGYVTDIGGSTSTSAGVARPILVQTSAWKLACAVTALKRNLTLPPRNEQPPLTLYRLAAPLYKDLELKPLHFINRILEDPAVISASPSDATRVHELIDTLISALHRAAAPILSDDD
jgi:transcriptional regulator with XRE-family HTH domain